MARIVSKEEYLEISKTLADKKRVLCHGVFDLVHLGHILHFQEAKSLGDILIVSITAEKYVRKGPGRPYFNDQMRLKFLSVIEGIDYVMLSECATADDVIEIVEPHLYVKGHEYANSIDDITGKIEEEVELVRKHGGDVYYSYGQTFSSTKLINDAFPILPKGVKEYMQKFSKKYSMNVIKEFSEKITRLKVIVVGDIIIDKYTYCNVQGLMSKDMGYSARFQHSEEYLGGVLAVAKHLSTFVGKLTVASIMGSETKLHKKLQEDLGGKMFLELEQSSVFSTIIKQRYVALNKDNDEMHKLFAVNNIPEPAMIDFDTLTRFKEKLSKIVPQYDLVVLCDYGHGVVDKEVMEIVQNKAMFLAVNCQTNSTNYGTNIITKYSHTDIFSLNQKELMLAYPQLASENEALYKLAEHLKSKGWLTKGAKGAIGIDDEKVDSCPAFATKVKDAIGSGDAFFAVASIFVTAGASIELGTFMGNIAGALSLNIVGNKKTLEKVNVLKYASTLLNI